MSPFELYGFHFSIYSQILLLFIFLAFIYQLYFYLRYMKGVMRREKQIASGKIKFDDQKPPVSVIICARDEEDNLRRFLPAILNQQYPEFEVIVVNDGSVDETAILLGDMQKQYPHLKTTFVPAGTSNLSTKKLAITLGVKAAKYDWLLFTDADCEPASEKWIASMARNFKGKTEIVLGYGAYFQEKGLINQLVTFDTLYNALLYLGFAKAGKPYMGVGRNMAYHKNIFYKNKGFASILHLRSGDDDLMINQRAYKENTSIETSPESVTWSVPKKTFSDWFYQKERHLSVSAYYNTRSRMRLAIEPFIRGMFYVLLILSVITLQPVVAAIGVLLYVVRFLIQMSVFNKATAHLGGRKYYSGLLLWDILLPLVSLYLLIFGRMGKKAARISWK